MKTNKLAIAAMMLIGVAAVAYQFVLYPCGALLFAITKLGTAEILDVQGYIKSTWPDQVIDIHNEMNTQSR